MTKLFFFLVFIAGSITVNAGNPDHTTTFKVNTDQSVIAWVGHKVTGEHNGTIGIKDGSLIWNHGVLESGTITIDMASVTVLDQQGGGKTKLEGHLKSDDFFGVEKFPTATLAITKAISKGDGLYTITADLTIKGITKPVTFDANVKTENNKLTATADIKVDRTLYDIRYGSGKFFDDLGDKAIYDEFDLNIKLVAAGK
ncbi:MAG TPA: YceI family protein [Saprospiraceae bacterium]|nr:YceI family protein [Saprospiraceae bacterium]